MTQQTATVPAATEPDQAQDERAIAQRENTARVQAACKKLNPGFGNKGRGPMIRRIVQEFVASSWADGQKHLKEDQTDDQLAHALLDNIGSPEEAHAQAQEFATELESILIACREGYDKSVTLKAGKNAAEAIRAYLNLKTSKRVENAMFYAATNL